MTATLINLDQHTVVDEAATLAGWSLVWDTATISSYQRNAGAVLEQVIVHYTEAGRVLHATISSHLGDDDLDRRSLGADEPHQTRLEFVLDALAS